MTRPVLAIDLGTTLGWAFLAESGRVSHGRAKLKSLGSDKKVDHAVRLRAFEDWLQAKLQLVGGGRGDVARETPVLGGTYASSVRVACHLEAVYLMALRAFLVPPTAHFGYEPATLKKWLTGKGNSSKEEMVQAVEAHWGLGITDHNQADAVALLHLHLERRASAE